MDYIIQKYDTTGHTNQFRIHIQLYANSIDKLEELYRYHFGINLITNSVVDIYVIAKNGNRITDFQVISTISTIQ